MDGRSENLGRRVNSTISKREKEGMVTEEKWNEEDTNRNLNRQRIGLKKGKETLWN